MGQGYWELLVQGYGTEAVTHKSLYPLPLTPYPFFMDTFEAIARRTSSRTYRPEALPRHVIERLLMAAVRAPNHKLTEPWRFTVLSGESKRRYADIRAAHRAK